MMSSRVRTAALSILLAVTMCGSTLAQEVSLPGGATSLREVHGDWIVTCAIQADAGGARTKRCALSQEQLQAESRQRVLALELAVTPEQTVTGALVLPFGLALDAGVTLQVDDGETGAPLRFSTCLPAGCIVPLALDAPMLLALRRGSALKLHMRGVAATEPLSFSISLTGFSAALERASELAR